MLRRFFSHLRRSNSPHRNRRGSNVGHDFAILPRRRLAGETLEARWYLAGDPIVNVNTNLGNFQVELFPSAAPQTVANFLSYVDSGKYNNAVVARAIPGFVVQTGGITSPSATYTSNSQFVPVAQNGTIPLEYNLPNTAGTLAMARGSTDNSASDEWFVNLVDNTSNLGPGGVSTDGFAVFGKVLGNGMQVVNSIAAVPTQDESSPPVGVDLHNLPLGGPNHDQLVQVTSMAVVNVEGTVFNDANGNGKDDSGEAGIAGRTVFVDVDGTGAPDTHNPSAVTDASGNYSITGVPAGSFTVREVLPAGAGLTTALPTVTFAADQTNPSVNFGEGPSIAGTVFTDLNNNGKLDAGEDGVAGRKVFLNIDNTGKPDNNPSTTTDASGRFSFAGLATGTYNVMEVAPANVTLSTNTQSVAVTANHAAAVANVGEEPALVGTVFNDLNVNGTLDASEPGLAGVTVFLNVDGSGAPSAKNPSAVTDANGRFSFSGLTAGTYSVGEVITANHGVTLTTPTSSVTVGASQAPTVNLGNVLTSTLAPLPVSVNTTPPATDADTAYINGLYFSLLGHDADAGGLAFWQQQMSGGASREAVAQGIWSSPEHRGLEVDQFYQTFLGRAAEPAGRDYWINSFATFGDEKVDAADFLQSPEYEGLHHIDLDFVNALYNDVALRPADSAGLAFWQNALSTGQTRAQVATAFVNGQEASIRLADSFYANFLHRAPDAASKQAMTTNLEQNTVSVEDSAVHVLGSDEYFNRVTKGSS
jgi:cyclophilin family peptidyl-prolyl cis-trans isomerase